ncbi:P-loop containing nucleoside triphosphate hydrolase protein [Mycena metata]|uniref:Peroxisomal ATPase PEX1 n=1 Tax=Mycena metata TaxID=1033252 RepID=A0AAD7P0N1_9AGAR|nr:P-loop containing nucleoside triphosphate hydrolase protein [Mycena metata]
MPRRARVHYVSLRSSLVNLPISLYGPLVERSVRPQHLAVHLTLVSPGAAEKARKYTSDGPAWLPRRPWRNSTPPTAADKGYETIEIDPQYALGLGLNQNDLVEIGLVHDLPLATSVATEPLTPDDWEIIDIHASHVESTLLSQVRVAKTGQEIDVWVLGRTRVRLRVVSVEPETKGNALLLTTNTEVSISPKPHAKKAPPRQLNGVPNGVPPTTTTAASTSAKDASTSHPTFSPQILHDAVYHKTLLKRLSPPPDPSAVPNAAPAPVTRVLNAGNATAAEADLRANGSEEVEEVYVRPVKGVPESHVAFFAGQGVEEWDLVSDSVRVTTTTTTVKVQTGHNAPTTKFLAGVDDLLAQCTQFCVRKFAMHASVNVVRGISSLLVTGRSGAGKTSIVQAVAKTLQEDSRTFTYTLYVDVGRYAAQPVQTIKALLSYWFKKASWHRPAVLVLDNLEKLVGVEVEHADSFRTRHITELFIALYSASARVAAPNSRGVVLLATASSTAALHPLINGAHIFEEVVSVKAPNKNARKEILARIVQERLAIARDMQVDTDSPLNYAALATQTEGYSATDLQDLVARAVHQVAVRSSDGSKPPLLASTDFDAAQVDFVPLSLRDVKLQKSDVSWADIGGLSETRRILRETLEWPDQSPLRLRSGLLLYGFPGCGKTLLASAVAKECGLNFISVKGPEILNKYIGASEQSVRDLFERATAAKPCVLFFDEFDSIAPKRCATIVPGVTDRVVNQMLTQMDGAEGLDGVYVLAATSRPDLIDSALLRPGRLDKSLFCDMPNLEDRKDILQAVARKVLVSPSVQIDEIAAATEGYSGADLQALLYNAHLEVVHSSISGTPLDGGPSTREDEVPVQFTVIGGSKTKVTSKADEMALQRRHEITSKHLSSVLKTMRPSVSAEERARLDRIYRAFISDRSGELHVPPEAGGVGNRVSLM